MYLLCRHALLRWPQQHTLGQAGALHLDCVGVGTTLELRWFFICFRSVFHRMVDFFKSVFLVFLTRKKET